MTERNQTTSPADHNAGEVPLRLVILGELVWQIARIGRLIGRLWR